MHMLPCSSLPQVVMSTSGGAAGLTLTVAHTAFLLEPSLNPGLEAQAAARICRLGAHAQDTCCADQCAALRCAALCYAVTVLR